jgi:hydrogenase/urease accessory protein HupE
VSGRRWLPTHVLLGCALLVSAQAWAHQISSATLVLTEIEAGRFRVHWQTSSDALAQDVHTPAVYPPECKLDGTVLDCGASGLVGTLAFPWLAGSETRLMVDIEWRNGTRLLRVLTRGSPRLTVYGIPPAAGLRALAPIVVDYTGLGIEHILTGFDHLLFVVALTILVRGRRRLIATITAFTVAHSLTLAAAAFGLLRLPSAPIEAAIALSIVLVCSECIRPADSLAHRLPWLVSFAFGLLHGLGFASALLDIGLPEQRLPLALLFFNVGVEIGQLGIIAVASTVLALVARIGLQRARLGMGLAYVMGTVAAYWSIERIVAVFVG